MHRHHAGRTASLSAIVLALVVTAAPAGAAPLLTNGGFESGFASWTRANQPGGGGDFFLQSAPDTESPVTGLVVPLPPEGSRAAIADGDQPGTHVLFQDFVVPTTATTTTVSFELYLQNLATQYFTPASLAFDLTGGDTRNQQFRVDVIDTTQGALFSVAAADILQNVYATQNTTALELGYTTITADLTSLFAARAGQTLRLRFAHVANVDLFVAGVDDVRLDTATVPEPATGLLLGTALMGLVARVRRRVRVVGPMACVAALAGVQAAHLRADSIPVTVLDPNLQVTTVLSTGLSQPIGVVFLDANDFFVLEKASGQIKRVLNGSLLPTPVLDLAVNSASERGLLSVVLSPSFPADPSVFVRWTESLSGIDSTAVSDVPLLGNRVDRFTWNGSQLVFANTVIRLRSRQTDNVVVPGQVASSANANEAGNHNGGVIRFGPDSKLYVFMGDQGRRGWMQNLANGPFLAAPQVDDTFGGPEPDDAHLTGVILRLNVDGTAPVDNPFFAAGAAIGGAVGANIQKIYSYGHRNGFGMAFDPLSGALWESENGDDAYSELNRVTPGMNGGWIQLAGPAARFREFRSIETNQFGRALQQVRYPPTRLAFTTNAALGRLVQLPGATYVDPKLSWRYEIGPSGMAFVEGDALGAEHTGTLWFGSARSFAQVGGTGGSLYRLRLTVDRSAIDTSADVRLADGVADNLFRTQKFEGTESESLVIGTGFGTVTDVQQAPDGSLYVVSLTDNTIYRISRLPV
ncbi:PQQ-dependent sugar dehydrogenase [Luteitalea sp.]